MDSLWKEFFHEDFEGLRAQYLEQSPEVSLLSYILDKKTNAEIDGYLKWAALKWGLAIVHRSFFQIHSPNKTSLMQNLQWTSEMLPIGSWDGHLIVGVLQDQGSKLNSISPRPVQVLCHPSDLTKIWKANFLSTTHIEKDSSSPEGLLIDEMTKTRSPMSESEQMLIDDDEASQISIDHLESKEGALDGLALNIAPPNLREQRTLTPDQASLESNASQSSPQQSTPTQSPPPLPQTNSSSTQSSSATNKSAHGIDLLAQALSHSQSSPQALKELIEYFSTEYQRALLLTLDDRTFGLFDGGPNHEFNTDVSRNRFELNIPSPFKICFDTLKPYHGFISPSQFNSQWLGAFNNGVIPENLTILPIAVNDRVIGFLCLMGTKETFSKQHLSRAQNLLENFVKLHLQPSVNAAVS